MLDDKQIIVDALKHAEKEHPKESCGFVLDGKYMPRNNVHEDPENHFKISPQAYLAAKKKGEIQAIVHSHPDGNNIPSFNDMSCQIESGIPWLLLPKDSSPTWFGDGLPIQPLVGRRFHLGVQDCVNVIRDWYKINRGVDLDDFPRTEEWWVDNPNMYIENSLKSGFEVVDNDCAFEVGDIFLMSIGQKHKNHGAVYLGNDMILHHLMNQLSCREPVYRYIKYLDLRVRLKND